ncbi:hypothetical protein R3P38DRAFT_3165053 [Favolaschia claudopus]|uniref:Uncharacterized protein n=1 Tax=Favolaschia claudopus TaxID=2862362 RepID=A0AAW0EHG8_9AGAR
MSFLATDVLQRLIAHPPLAQTLKFTQVQTFLDLTHRIWPEIVGKRGILPEILPEPSAAFLSSVLGLSPTLITLCWTAFSDLAAVYHAADPAQPLDNAFRIHGHKNRIGI